MELINTTPHEITIFTNNGKLVLPASGNLVRVSNVTETIGSVNGIPLTKTTYGDVVGLPDPVPGKAYIVSTIVAQKCKNRNDVFIINESVRNDKGQVIGCSSLGVIR